MIGDAYFDLRSRLGKDLFQLAQLVHEQGGSGDDTHILENLIASLNDPFVFVVVGEVNVGKSTFLNALFGADFSRTGVMPTTDKIYFFKHGPVVQSTPITPTLEEVRVPCSFLKDFHIVDTPGTNSIENEHQQITERFVPTSDLVIVVFSAMNPWGASAWQFLDKVHSQWQRQIIFVLQQKDLRSEEEIQVITDYMKQLSMQRYGREFPLFAVSAKKAYMAKSSGLDRERLFEGSGYGALENYINNVVARQPLRLNKLNSSLRLARQILDGIAERVTTRLNGVGDRRALLDKMQADRDTQAQRTLGKFQLVLDASDHDFREVASRIVILAKTNLTVRQTFASRTEDTRFPPNLDHKLNQDLLANAGERWHHTASILEDDFKNFENHLATHWKGELYLSELRNKDDSESASHEAKRRFISKVESTLRRFVLGIEIEPTVEPGLKSTRALARRFPWIIGALALVSMVLMWFMGWKVGLTGALITLATGGGMLLMIRSQLANTLSALLERFEASRAGLRQMLDDQTRQETEHAFGIFSRVFQPYRVDMEAETIRLTEQSQHLHALQQSMQKLAQELQGKAASS